MIIPILKYFLVLKDGPTREYAMLSLLLFGQTLDPRPRKEIINNGIAHMIIKLMKDKNDTLAYYALRCIEFLSEEERSITRVRAIGKGPS